MISSLAQGLVGLGSFILHAGLIALAVSRWNRHPGASLFAASSGVISLITQAAYVAMPMVLRSLGGDGSSMLMLGFAGVGLVNLVGQGLLIAAVFNDRPSDGPTQRW